MYSSQKILKLSVISFVLTILLGFVAYPLIFNYLVKNQICLRKGSLMRGFYLKYPISLDFSVYFFNVTNPEEVHNGGLPILNEVGPYTYDLYKERINVEDDEDEDSLTYTPFDRYYFNYAKSKGLKPDDYVTILHPLVVGIVNVVNRDAAQFLKILDGALNPLFNTTTIFLTAKVKDILFDGMAINCSSSKFSVRAVCSQIDGQVPGIKKLPEDEKILLYSVLGTRNGTSDQRIKVSRGTKDYRDVGKLLAVDNDTESTLWSGEECNRYRGTDGWIFPPFSQHLTQLWIHPTDICRNIHADLVERTSLHGIPVGKYYADFGDPTSNPEESCFCTETSCPPKGVIDLTQCLRVPLFVTLPHYLHADESLAKKVRGLNASTDEHIIRILFEGVLAIPVEAQIRLQFNMPIQPLEKITLMNTVPDMLHPALWIELGVILDGWLLKLVQLFAISQILVVILNYAFLIASICGICYGLYQIYVKRNGRVVPITPVQKNEMSMQQK